MLLELAIGDAKEVVQDLPDYLIGNLENELYGKDYLIDLDKQLLKLIQKN